MAIIHIRSQRDKEQTFTELIEENKLRFYKTAKAILKRKNKNNIVPIDERVERGINMARYDRYELDEYGIKEAIECLKEDFKLIVILYYYDNYSIKEISQIVNIPEGTVKSRLSKAREILKQKLGKEEI